MFINQITIYMYIYNISVVCIYPYDIINNNDKIVQIMFRAQWVHTVHDHTKIFLSIVLIHIYLYFLLDKLIRFDVWPSSVTIALNAIINSLLLLSWIYGYIIFIVYIMMINNSHHDEQKSIRSFTQHNVHRWLNAIYIGMLFIWIFFLKMSIQFIYRWCIRIRRSLSLSLSLSVFFFSN